MKVFDRLLTSTKKMNKPNILMFHRVLLNKSQNVNEIYFQRNMITSIENIFHIIDDYLIRGFQFGNIEDAIKDNNYVHLSFDDGFKEHLQVAYLLGKKYDFAYDNVTFSINTGNSFTHQFTGMDVVYELISNRKLRAVEEIAKIKLDDNDITEIKNKVARLNPYELKLLSESFKEIKQNLKQLFLDRDEVLELSNIFSIASHGVTHRFLTSHQIESNKEIAESKELLEKAIGKKINVFCYPEGKNDEAIQTFCKNSGYKFGLSIRHEQNNKFCIGRRVV